MMRAFFRYPLHVEHARNDSLAGYIELKTPIALDAADEPIRTVHDLAELLLSTVDAPLLYELGQPDFGATPAPTTCGVCERTWDDAIPSTWTPVPSGRCPFEYLHEEN